MAPLATLLCLAPLLIAALQGVPAAPPPAPIAPAEPTALSLDQAISLALSANRSLAAARLGREVARAGVEVAGERPNPGLAFERTKETPHESLTLTQPVESAGKRRRRIALAEAQVGSGEADFARSALDVRNQVRRAFFALAAAERRAAEGEARASLAGRTLETARQRFAAGDAPRLEALQAELAAAQADNEARNTRGLLVGARGDLNTLLGRPPETALAIRDGGAELAAVPEPAAAAALARRANAELALLDRRIAEEAARLDLARALRFPDPTVDGAVTHGAAPDFDWGWRAGVAVNLPIWNRHRAGVLVEEATLAQLKAQRDARAAEIGGAVYSAVAQAAAQREQVRRFHDEILPRAEEVERMAEDSYRSGQTGLVALLQALQATRDVRLAAIQAGLDFQSSLADLEKAMGAPLP